MKEVVSLRQPLFFYAIYFGWTFINPIHHLKI